MKATCAVLIFLFFCIPGVLQGQLTVVPASDGCACDGGFTYAPEPGTSTFFILYDPSGAVIGSFGSSSGSWTLSNVCEGVYTLQANAGGVLHEALLQVAVAGFNPGVPGTLNICSSAPATSLSSSITNFQPGGMWTRPDGSVFNGMYQPASMDPGFYIYSVLVNGCEFQTGVIVTEIQNANPGTQTTNVICDAYSPFAMFDYLEGDPDTGGTWYYNSGQMMDGIYDPATMSSGLFVYAIDNIPGCNTVFATMFVDERVTPNAGENSTLIICNGAAPFSLFSHIPGNPDAGGFWFRPNGAPFSGNFTPGVDPAGIYRYSVSANAPCQDQESFITISYSNTDPSGLNSTFIICESQSPADLFFVLSGNPVAGGVWTNDNGQAVSPIYDPQIHTSGNFHYYVNNVGCSPQGATVQVTELPAGEAGDDIVTEVCVTDSPLDLHDLLVNADPGGIFRDVSGTPVSNPISFSSTQLLQFTYEISTPSCPTDIADIIIAVVAPPVAPANQAVSHCHDGNFFNLNTIYPDVLFPEWYDENGDQISSQYNTAAGSAEFLIVSESNNVCPSLSATLELNVYFPLFQDQAFTQDVCIGDSPIDLHSFLATGKESFGNWFDGSGNIIPPVYVLTSPGTETVSFVGMDNGPCPTNTITVFIHIYPEVYAGNDHDLLVCETHPVIDLPGLPDPGADAGGQWYEGNAIYPSVSYQPVANDLLVLEYVVAGNAGCPEDRATFTIEVQEGFAIEAGNLQSTCNGSGPIQIGAPALPGTTYAWFPLNNLSDATSAQPTVTLVNNTTVPEVFTYELTAYQGVCSATDAVMIEVLPTPAADAGEAVSLCSGETLSLHAPNGAFQVLWTPSELFDDPAAHDQWIQPDYSTTVSLQVTNAYGCSSSDDVEIEVFPVPVLDHLFLPASGCSPLTVEDTWPGAAGGNLSIVWAAGGESQQGAQYSFTLDNAGLYDLTLTATNSFGCSTDTTAEDLFEVYPEPFASFRAEPSRLSILNNTAHFENQSILGETYLWDFTTGVTSTEEHPVYSFPNDESGSFEVCLLVTSGDGCTDATCKTIILENDYVLFAPNAITPNSDGINDYFLPVLSGFEESTYRLRIYDRWGTLIFQTNDVHEPWMGNVREGEHYAMNSVYQWIIEVKVDLIADFKRYEGSVLVVR